MILYLLPFKNRTHFKYGFTDTKNQGFNRPHKTLNDLYEIDFANAKMVTANDPAEIRILENEIRSNFSKYFKTDAYLGKDGYSEILPIKFLPIVISFIEAKAKLIEWQGLRMASLPEPIIFSSEKEIKPKQHPISYGDTLSLLDFLSHPYGESLMVYAKNEIEEVILFESDCPGIFKFINGTLGKALEYKAVKRGSFPTFRTFIITVFWYYTSGGEKEKVILYFNPFFIADVKSGFISEQIVAHKAKTLDLNLLEDIGSPKRKLNFKN